MFDMANQTLVQFEAETGLGPTFVARLIGTAYPTYAKYRAEHRPLPLYHERHIEALRCLSTPNLLKLIERHVYD